MDIEVDADRLFVLLEPDRDYMANRYRVFISLASRELVCVHENDQDAVNV
jgi:hypothetical protein